MRQKTLLLNRPLTKISTLPLKYNFLETPRKFIIAELSIRKLVFLQNYIFDIHHANIQGTYKLPLALALYTRTVYICDISLAQWWTE